jgi:hypothetical protein
MKQGVLTLDAASGDQSPVVPSIVRNEDHNTLKKLIQLTMRKKISINLSHQRNSLLPIRKTASEFI